MSDAPESRQGSDVGAPGGPAKDGSGGSPTGEVLPVGETLERVPPGENGAKGQCLGVSLDEKKLYIDVWSKAVDTQMHFNDMSARSRQFGLAFVAAALGLAVVLGTRGQEAVLNLGYLKLHASVFVVLASAVALYAVRLLDLKVYHRMLRGAVYFGEDFEQTYMKKVFSLEKGMTQAISHFSRRDDAKVILCNGKYHYAGTDRRTAEKKIAKFYNFSIGALLVLTVILFLLTSDLPMVKWVYDIMSAIAKWLHDVMWGGVHGK